MQSVIEGQLTHWPNSFRYRLEKSPQLVHELLLLHETLTLH